RNSSAATSPTTATRLPVMRVSRVSSRSRTLRPVREAAGRGDAFIGILREDPADGGHQVVGHERGAAAWQRTPFGAPSVAGAEQNAALETRRGGTLRVAPPVADDEGPREVDVEVEGGMRDERRP